MASNNDHIPEIIYDWDDEDFKLTMAKVAAVLDHNHFGDSGRQLRGMAAKTDVAIEHAVNKTASDTRKEVEDLIKSRQYHSKSGYGPGVKAFDRKTTSQHLADNVRDDVNGHQHKIWADVQNNGYNYSQAFEFGLLTRNYPAHHPFEDAANHMQGRLDENVDEAIRKGFD